jgi:GT2 family glycosyltransferase
VLVIDDASTDGTRSILEEMSRLCPQLRVFFLTKNTGGASAPRNLGIHEMSTPNGVFFDDDDVSHTQRALIHCHQLGQGFDFSYVGSIRVRDNGQVLQVVNDSFQLDKRSLEEFKLQVLLGIMKPKSQLFAVPSSVLAFKRKAILQLGGFDEQLQRCEDIDLALRALEAGYTIDARGEVLVRRLVHHRSYKSKNSDVLNERVVQLKNQKGWSMRLRTVSFFHHKSRLSASQRNYSSSIFWALPLAIMSPKVLWKSFLRWRVDAHEAVEIK